MAETSRHRNLLIGLCLTTAILAVYWPVLHFGFINFDDRTYVAENPHLRGGLTLRELGWAFTTGLDQWMPVTWFTRMLECQWFGLNAGAHHLVNVLFHIANSLLLFGVLNRVTGAPWRSALVAALFALHPLHVESVAWVTDLKDVLSMCFGMLTIGAYVRYVEHVTVHGSRSKTFYGLALLSFTLALMSKPMLVTLPFVLLLLDYWPLGRTRWAEAAIGERVKLSPSQLFKEKLPFFALAAAAGVATLWGQRTAGAVASLERLPLGARIASSLLSYAGYLGKAFWPTGLAVFYPLNARLSWPAAMIAGVGVVGVTTAVIWRARREPWFATGWFWYLGTLVPVIGLVQVGIVQTMADRYTYIPLVGIFTMLCWSVPRDAMERRISKVAVWVATVALLAVCAMLTRIQVGYWKNSETLFRHALNVTRDNWLAHGNLGMALEEEGKVQEAIAHYEQALWLKPDMVEAHNNLGTVLLQEGKIEDAIKHYGQALRIDPNNAQAHFNLGGALEQAGKREDAIDQYRRALQTEPNLAEAHNNLAVALMRLGKLPEAIEHFERALRIKPDYAEVHNNLGGALTQLGRTPEAIGHYEQALRLNPDYPEAHYNLGVVLEHVGRVPEAMGHYEQALRIRPGLAAAQNSLARLRAVQ